MTPDKSLDTGDVLPISKEEIARAVGGKIRAIRTQLLLTLRELSERTGVSLAFISQIELGKNTASCETIAKIASGLGMRMHELFEGISMGPALLEAKKERKAQTKSEIMGSLIREARKEKGLTLKDVEKEARISLGYLSQLECGTSAGSIEMYVNVARVLGISLEKLFDVFKEAPLEDDYQI